MEQSDFVLKEIIDPEELQRLLLSFTDATGLSVSIIDDEGDLIMAPSQEATELCKLINSCEEGIKRCRETRKKAGRQAAQLGEPYICFCHAGLVKWVAPIVVEDKVLGHILCGQVVMWDLDWDAVQEIVNKNKDLGIPVDKLGRAVMELKVVSGRKVQASAELLRVMANYIVKTGVNALKQRRELNRHQALLAEEIQRRKEIEKSVEQSVYLYPVEKERILLGRVRMGDRVGAKEILNDLLGDVLFRHAGNPEVIKARILELVVILSRAAVEGGASLERLLGLNYQYLQELSEIEEMEEMLIWIVRVLDQFIDGVYEARNVKNLAVIEQAVAYINSNFRKDITLDDVARHVYLSPSYISHLFKQELGCTVIEYLTKVRIEEAKRLLLDTDYNLKNISEAVGYNDTSYFVRVFKKIESVTPGTFRSMMAS